MLTERRKTRLEEEKRDDATERNLLNRAKKKQRRWYGMAYPGPKSTSTMWPAETIYSQPVGGRVPVFGRKGRR